MRDSRSLRTSRDRWRLLLATAILGVAALPSRAGGEALAEWAASIAAPRLSGSIAAGSIQVGRGRIDVRTGVPVRLMWAGDTPCGVMIEGPADFTYRVEDRFSQPVARRNLERASSLHAATSGAALTVSTEIRWAAIWSFDLAAKLAGDTPSPSGDSTALSAEVRELLDRPLFSGPAADLLLARELPAPGIAYAVLGGRREELLLEVDPVVTRAEGLYSLVKVGREDSRVFAGRRFARELATQPIGRQWWDQFPAPVVVTHEAIEVVNEGGSRARVTSRLRVEGVAPSSGVFASRLVESTGDDSKQYPVRVASVAVGGQPRDFVHLGSDLFVALQPPLRAGQALEIEVVHEGELALRAGGDSFWALGTWPWYPKPALNGELATAELTVRVPPPFTPFASGRTVSRQVEGGVNVLRTELTKPMSFPVIAAGRYHEYSETHDGLTARIATYALADEGGAKRLLNNFFAAEACYRRKLNTEFPFREITILELNDWGYGQAPSGIVFITREAFNTLLDETARSASGGVNERYFHEIAHAYWAHALKFPSWEENWLSESFASYTAALCLDAFAKKSDGFAMASSVRRWRADVAQLGEGTSIYLAERLAGKGFRDVSDRQILLYSKGPLVLHALRLELQRRAGSVEEGDKQFLGLLRSFLKSFPYQWGSTAGLIGILEQITRGEWQAWFERYVFGTEVPDLERAARTP